MTGPVEFEFERGSIGPLQDTRRDIRFGRPQDVEVLTFGCRLNLVESEAMRRAAVACGQAISSSSTPAR